MIKPILESVQKFSIMLTGLIGVLAAVTWLAARDAIVTAAPVVVFSLAGLSILAGVVTVATFAYIRVEAMRTRKAELARDRALASVDARRAELHLEAEGAMLAAQVRFWAFT